MRYCVEGLADDFAADDDFLLNASEPSLAAIWDNSEDDIFVELLEADVSIPRQA